MSSPAQFFTRAYTAHDQERPVREDDLSGRSPFQRDSARIQHSAALRRLTGKAQVTTPVFKGQPFSESRRTRLSHTLECAQIGREMGAVLGCDTYLVEAACLAHDVGHPPFGHNGELALDEFARSAGGFEGNAQTFRILTRLEPKSPGGRGLNLTRAVLDAATKYPWGRGGKPGAPDSPKFGVYDDDRSDFDWMRSGAPDGRRCVEAQVMDWADDVSYSVHDLEDGLLAGRLSTADFTSGDGRGELLEFAAARYAPEGTETAELGEALDRLVHQRWWPCLATGYDSYEDQARLKYATSQLIGRFCSAAQEATRRAHGRGRIARYRCDLVVPRRVRLECDVLKALHHLYVIHSPEEQSRRARQREQLTELAHGLLGAPDKAMRPQFREEFEKATCEVGRIRAVTDQVASLDDAGVAVMLARLAA
ncbi:deoxyguanosinetriphosphate triphosphohydrolase [Nocardiopsis sp. NPDC050513]|uniref:deoxyguanosinetriphosphate triphosphohydrolase n=1 Tax=Nocardiopsis sp. NPDC050513 TaxID=3364338 RepID=UPI0037B1F4D9